MAYVQLGDICNIVKGEIGITKAIPGDFSMVTTGEFRKSHNEFQLDTKAILVPLVSATGHGHASIKRIHYQEGKFAFGSILAACIPRNENYSAKFLYIYFNLMKDYVLVPLMKGSANVSLTLGNLKKAKVPDISLEIQLKIVALYSKIKIEQDKATDLLINQKDDIVSLRQSILQEAVEGRLTADWRANNPDTEDASILLKRIQKEKAQLVKDKKIKKEKALPKTTKDEIPYELPLSWIWVKLGQVSSLINGDRGKNYPSKEHYIPEGIPFITARNLGERYLKHDALNYISEERYNLLRSGQVQLNDILYCLRGSLGKCSIVEGIEQGAIASSLVIVRIAELVDSIYMLNYFSSSLGKQMIYKHDNGTAQPNLSASNVKEFYLPLPPLEEQKAIVQKVNALMGLCDSLEQEVQQSQEHSAQLMQSCLREVFEGERKTVEI